MSPGTGSSSMPQTRDLRERRPCSFSKVRVISKARCAARLKSTAEKNSKPPCFLADEDVLLDYERPKPRHPDKELTWQTETSQGQAHPGAAGTTWSLPRKNALAASNGARPS